MDELSTLVYVSFSLVAFFLILCLALAAVSLAPTNKNRPDALRTD